MYIHIRWDLRGTQSSKVGSSRRHSCWNSSTLDGQTIRTRTGPRGLLNPCSKFQRWNPVLTWNTMCMQGGLFQTKTPRTLRVFALSFWQIQPWSAPSKKSSSNLHSLLVSVAFCWGSKRIPRLHGDRGCAEEPFFQKQPFWWVVGPATSYSGNIPWCPHPQGCLDEGMTHRPSTSLEAQDLNPILGPRMSNLIDSQGSPLMTRAPWRTRDNPTS